MIVKLNAYKNMVGEMFDSVGKAVGIHVMLLVLEHAHWKIRQKYEEAEYINFSEKGIDLDGLDEVETMRAILVAHEFVMFIVATLGRLVGTQLASQLTEQLKSNSLEMEG